jgi:hypothetical protein
MLALIEIIFLYMSLIAGGVTLWFSIYQGYPLSAGVARALVVGATFFFIGVAARFVLYLSVYYGNRGGRQSEKGEAGSVARGVPESIENLEQ